MCTLLYVVKRFYSSSIHSPTNGSNVTHKSEGILGVVMLEYSKMSLHSNNEFQSVYKVMQHHNFQNEVFSFSTFLGPT